MKLQVIDSASGDWVIVRKNDEVIFEGHRVSNFELGQILAKVAEVGAIHTTISDEDMEEGNY